MSDTDNDTENTSFLGNLKNTVKYKVHKAVYNPDANKFAENQKIIDDKKKKEDDQKKQLEQDKKENATDTTDLSVGLVLKHTLTQMKSLAVKIVIPFIALLIAMFVTNDMIVFPKPVRLIIFIVVFIFCTILPFYAGIFVIYYLLKIIYAWYKRNVADKNELIKHEYMPTIFTLLPITTSMPCSAFGRFFYYPFNYPKYDKEEYENGGKLKEIMDSYLINLKESFTDFDKYKSNPLFIKLLDKIQDNFKTMHIKEVRDCVKSDNTNELNKKEVESEPTAPTEQNK